MSHWTWFEGCENRPSPCLYCKPPERHENCHATCRPYQEYRSDLDMERKRKTDEEKGSIPFNWKTNRKRGQP